MTRAAHHEEPRSLPVEAARLAAHAGLRLRQGRAGLELAIPGGPAVGAATALLRRPRTGRDLLWRAVLAGAGSVVDATAGLGADAFHLAAKGASVTMIERSPVLAALLRDALERAREGAFGAEAATAAARLSLVVGEAVDVLGAVAGAAPADVVYLDPMFAAAGSTAAPPKGMAVLRQLFAAEGEPVGTGEPTGAGEPAGVGESTGYGASAAAAEHALLAAARSAAARRVVVKRALKATALAGVAPSGSISGRTVRFDVYAPL